MPGVQFRSLTAEGIEGLFPLLTVPYFGCDVLFCVRYSRCMMKTDDVLYTDQMQASSFLGTG